MSPRTLALSALALASTANASITGVTGQTTWLGINPSSCVPGTLVTPNAYAWDEQIFTVASGILCDEIGNPGSSATPAPGLLTGTFASHFIHFDSRSGVNSAQGTVTFNQPILAVIWKNALLDSSDVLCGAIGTTYPTFYPPRNLGLSTFTYTGNTLSFNFFAVVPTADISQIRVITAVPAPASAGVLGLAGLVAVRRRR